MSRVTVGLPTYNSQKFISQTLEAILGQTYSDFVLVINDDASTDNTCSICEGYAVQDPRIRFTKNRTNRGAAINYQAVFHLADTEYFRWAAHDDSLAPELLERCIAILDERPDVVMCYPRSYNIDEQGKVFGACDDDFGFDDPDCVKRFRGVLRGMYGHAGNPMFAVIRRQVMAKTALIAPFPSSDMTFLAELVLYGKFHEIQDRLFYHRMYSGTSNQLGMTAAEYNAWHDRSKAGKLSLPKLLRLKALFVGVERSPLSSVDKFRCIGAILDYYLSPRNLAKLWRQNMRAIRFRRQRSMREQSSS